MEHHNTSAGGEADREPMWGAQTQRAVENFQISTFRFPFVFLESLAWIKQAAAETNSQLGRLDTAVSAAIVKAAGEIDASQFPVDVFQTGSGTSTNMNMNEVLARLASRSLGRPVHPNDHVNLGQSSNDVIPTAIHVSASRLTSSRLMAALETLAETIAARAESLRDVIKTGRTHLMDAVPLRMSEELSGWEWQVRDAAGRLRGALPLELAIGATAVGTGLNTDPRFGPLVASKLARRAGLPFVVSKNYYSSLAGQDAALALSGALRGVAAVLMKIANDLRWMNSGPVAGLAEIELPPLQAGSSIMPGKVNPVIPEAVAMVSAQVMGMDTAVTIAAQSGNFQLNVMLPLIAWNVLTAIELLTNAATALGDNAIAKFTVNEKRIAEFSARNPMLVTALAPRIGYEKCAEIAFEALASDRSIFEVARDRTNLPEDELRELLDPANMV